MAKKREKWRLPKTFKVAKKKKGTIQRQDGEPVFLTLKKHENDRTLTTNETIKCCDCGLAHSQSYNVFKTPDDAWYLVVRSYRLPGTGKKKK